MKREDGVESSHDLQKRKVVCGFQSRMHNLQQVQILKRVLQAIEVLGTPSNLKPKPQKAAKVSGPKTGDKRGRSQRKSFKGAKGSKPSERRKRRK